MWAGKSLFYIAMYTNDIILKGIGQMEVRVLLHKYRYILRKTETTKVEEHEELRLLSTQQSRCLPTDIVPNKCLARQLLNLYYWSLQSSI